MKEGVFCTSLRVTDTIQTTALTPMLRPIVEAPLPEESEEILTVLRELDALFFNLLNSLGFMCRELFSHVTWTSKTFK